MNDAINEENPVLPLDRRRRWHWLPPPSPPPINPIYWALTAMFFVQIAGIIQIHSILGALTVCDTLLLLIAKANEGGLAQYFIRLRVKERREKEEKATINPKALLDEVNREMLRPYLIVVGCVAFEALIFVTFTHSLEAVFCADDVVDNVPKRRQWIFLAITLANIVLKLILLTCGGPTLNLSTLSLAKRMVLHLLAPSEVVILAAFDHFYCRWTKRNFVCVDIYLNIAICALLTAIVIPMLLRHLPYLFASVPDHIRVDALKEEIETRFPQAKCLHLHLFRKFSTVAADSQGSSANNDSFEVIVHLAIGTFLDVAPPSSNETNDISPTDKHHHHRECSTSGESQHICEEYVGDMIRELSALLKSRGASQITIQPHLFRLDEARLIARNFPSSTERAMQCYCQQWRICEETRCSVGEKSCCDRNLCSVAAAADEPSEEDRNEMTHAKESTTMEN